MRVPGLTRFDLAKDVSPHAKDVPLSASSGACAAGSKAPLDLGTVAGPDQLASEHAIRFHL